ncbi:MAG TPA: anti-sigma factor [Candidatus Binatia bacterium]|nr:anti-sigma factor [Candidatus Binatia bacterium]
MECSHAQSLLEIYLDQELDPVRHLEIEEHLHGCAGCAQSYGDRQVIRQSLKAESLYFKAPPKLEKRIQRSLRQAAKAETPARWLSGSWVKMAAPLAVAALVVLMLVPHFSGPSPDDLLTQQVIASHIRSLMVDHLADIPSTDEHTVKPWFNGKLDFSPPVADPVKGGFPLIGGRLDYLNNRPVAALIYRRDKHLINVFVWPASTGQQLAQSHKTQQGYNLIRWTSSAMNFWAVSDLEANQLTKFSELLKSSIPSS